MADAWSTVVTREPEWDDKGRARAFALEVWEAKKCPQCGNYDTLLELPRARRFVTWHNHGGRVMDVRQYRCLACGAVDSVRRDWDKRNRKRPDPPEGQYAESDGRIFAAQPLDDEET